MDAMLDRRPVVRRHSEAVLALQDDVYLVTCDGDIHKVLQSLRCQEIPGREVLNRTVTAVMKSGQFKRCEIREFPPATLEVLRQAERNSSMEELVEDFERRRIHIGNFTPQQVAGAAIRVLEKCNLVSRIDPQTVPSTDVPVLHGEAQLAAANA
jgi:septation ring formation regulator EzrA